MHLQELHILISFIWLYLRDVSIVSATAVTNFCWKITHHICVSVTMQVCIQTISIYYACRYIHSTCNYLIGRGVVEHFYWRDPYISRNLIKKFNIQLPRCVYHVAELFDAQDLVSKHVQRQDWDLKQGIISVVRFECHFWHNVIFCS